MPLERRSTPPPTQEKICYCVNTNIQKASTFRAICAGMFSILTLILSLVLPLWVKTTEFVPARPPHTGIWEIKINIGMFSVCPYITRQSLENLYFYDPEKENTLNCTSIHIFSDWSGIEHSKLGLWTKISNSTNVIYGVRVCRVFVLLGFVSILISVVLTLVAQFVRKHSLLVAALLYAFGGLMLGCCLIILVSAVSDEFSIYQSEDSNPDRYTYNWSLLLALISFLSSEVSSLLSFSAYMDQFSSHQQFLYIIPGMTRKISEMKLRLRQENTYHHTTRIAEEGDLGHSDSVDLLRCSFVHCSSPDSSLDSLRNLRKQDESPNFHQNQSQSSFSQSSYSQTHLNPAIITKSQPNNNQITTSVESIPQSSTLNRLIYRDTNGDLDSGNKIIFDEGERIKCELATFPRPKKRVAILENCNISVPSPV
ncbi:uncharacterized protein LOC111702380 [Eurytemora carolleeae]|uniref:uncharacterized protein LOC111702380 n=1 Tax=Eurytemora carolleeae TaxID=1294199 RepID=UPI000C78D35A|nr:uncharacterized protein LOC111702380 [Eurytemora carolleeae]|eukprot:XP_023329816.1 uncharacterized protein LOC111702380 [Eurytemora affinis]